MIKKQKTVTSKNHDKNPITNFIVDIQNLQCADNNAYKTLIGLHLQARQLREQWLAVKHDCAHSHLHVALQHKTHQPITNLRREIYDK